LDNRVHLFSLLMKFEVEKQFLYILKFGTWKKRKLVTVFSFSCPNHLHYLVYVCELTFKYLWMSLLSYSHLEAFTCASFVHGVLCECYFYPIPILKFLHTLLVHVFKARECASRFFFQCCHLGELLLITWDEPKCASNIKIKRNCKHVKSCQFKVLSPLSS
jgi:hypothetical protein